jgi:hypothetical protein
MKKFKLIMLDTPIIVSDDECKVGDKCITNGGLGRIGVDVFQNNVDYTIKPLKIISENPDFSLLNEVDCIKIGYVNADKLAEHSSEMQEGTYTPQHKITYKHGFIDGLKSSQFRNDKMFSLDDVERAFNVGVNAQFEVVQLNKTNVFDFLQNKLYQLTQSLHQPKVFDVVIECEYKDGYGNWYYYNTNVVNFTDTAFIEYRPLISDGKIKIIKVI